jgi:hypothetical protein
MALSVVNSSLMPNANKCRETGFKRLDIRGSMFIISYIKNTKPLRCPGVIFHYWGIFSTIKIFIVRNMTLNPLYFNVHDISILKSAMA